MTRANGELKGNFQRMQYVFVVDQNQQPLMPCQPARARELLRAGKAAVWRRYPFTIILKEHEGGDKQPLQVKLDPGSKQTGIAIVVEGKRGKRVVWAAVLEHRGQQIKKALLSRRQLRRARRNRHTRYRPARFANRRRDEEWLPPSILSRVQNVWTWVNRLRRFTPVSDLSLELVKFDTQALQNPAISGIEYQQGELQGYEVREYLLEKWQRRCAYCGKTNVPLEIEHLLPKSCGGSDRVSNLTLACHTCNLDKGIQTAAEYGYPHLQTQARQPLQAVAAVNAARWTLYRWLTATGNPVAVGTGGRTKFNRTQQGYPKTHWIDAACVGASGNQVFIAPDHAPLWIKAAGHGSRQMCKPDQYSFPRTTAKTHKRVHGFQTGDLVKALVPTGKKMGTYQGRVAVRSSGAFNIITRRATVQGISYKHCVVLHKADGYNYQQGEAAHSSPA